MFREPWSLVTSPLMVRDAPSPLLSSPAFSPPTRMPSTLRLGLLVPSFFASSASLAAPSKASLPSMVFSPFNVTSTVELSRATIPAVLSFSVRLILVLSSVRSTLVSLLSSLSSRFTPISMPLPPVVSLESLTVRSTSAPSPTLMMVLSSLVSASAVTSAEVSVWVLVSLVSTFTPSTTIFTSLPSVPSVFSVFLTSSITVMVFSVVVSDVELFSVLLPEASVDCVSLSVGVGTTVPLSELSVVGGTTSGALPSLT